jgi:hypothetical protein
MRRPYAKAIMSMKLLLASLSALALAAPAAAQVLRSDQDHVYQGRRTGELRPLREIEARIVPRMQARGADYIGAEIDGGRYRLKFVRAGRVIWVDVDGRTGALLGRAGE